ncbi:MAG: HAD hydrolase family protein [Alphaproteobacteria bacterium]|nr:HAD hydrolase family protein [Alphaproteobacteria bacterium]
MSFTPQALILDVDGVLTDGAIYYSETGKVLKRFGPDDNDAIQILRPHLHVHVISGDKRGFPITKRRIDDMKLPLDLVSTLHRVDWIAERWPLDKVIYMGDGIFDAVVFRQVGYSIAPADADPIAKRFANHVTQRSGGNRAVAEACLHVLDMFFEPFDLFRYRESVTSEGEAV